VTTTSELLAAAIERRGQLLERLHGEGTDTYRLLHGVAEGAPGLTVDRYGPLLLVQAFRTPIGAEEVEALADTARRAVGLDLHVVCNHRGAAAKVLRGPTADEGAQRAATPSEGEPGPGERSESASVATESSGDARPSPPPAQFEPTSSASPPWCGHVPSPAALEEHACHEAGVRFLVRARHRGQDPWLFLDLRAGRRWVMARAAGRSVLNLFAYTGGVGLVAARGGASEVLNVDFAASSLAVAEENARLNELAVAPRCLQSDVFPAVRQLAGLSQPEVVRGRRMPPFPKLGQRRYGLVFLDPPRLAKSPFGVVDLVNDYAAVFKPALLATAEGGTIVCCNNVAGVRPDEWLDRLRRSAAKAGRVVRDAEWITPEEDFPSRDGQHPLKMVALGV
jgi:23S rRNA (cytosine1962-C5)-methyltransferase